MMEGDWHALKDLINNNVRESREKPALAVGELGISSPGRGSLVCAS